MSLFSDISTWDVGKTLEKVEKSRAYRLDRDMVNVFYCLVQWDWPAKSDVILIDSLGLVITYFQRLSYQSYLCADKQVRHVLASFFNFHSSTKTSRPSTLCLSIGSQTSDSSSTHVLPGTPTYKQSWKQASVGDWHVTRPGTEHFRNYEKARL